jgi:hypothetical protein
MVSAEQGANEPAGDLRRALHAAGDSVRDGRLQVLDRRVTRNVADVAGAAVADDLFAARDKAARITAEFRSMVSPAPGASHAPDGRRPT